MLKTTLFNLEIDLFGALRGVPPIEGPLEELQNAIFIDICVVRGMFCIVSEGVLLAIYVVRGCY